MKYLFILFTLLIVASCTSNSELGDDLNRDTGSDETPTRNIADEKPPENTSFVRGIVVEVSEPSITPTDLPIPGFIVVDTATKRINVITHPGISLILEETCVYTDHTDNTIATGDKIRSYGRMTHKDYDVMAGENTITLCGSGSEGFYLQKICTALADCKGITCPQPQDPLCVSISECNNNV